MTGHRWQSFYEKEVKPQLEYPSVPITDFLKQAAEQFPDHDAVYYFGRTIKYKELLHLSYRFANALVNLGVKKGDRVALMLPNVPQYVICYYGILFMGGIVVQTNPLYAEHDLRKHLLDSGAETIVCLDLVCERVQKVRNEVNIKSVIVAGIQDYLPFPKNVLYPFIQKQKGTGSSVPVADYRKDPSVYTFRKWIKQSSSRPVSTDTDPVNDVAVLQYTGGTTGIAKGVMLTHYNLVTNAVQSQHWVHKTTKGRERILTSVPLFHVYGMSVCMNFSVLMAGTMILVPKFEVKSVLETIQKVKPTLFPGAPTMYIAIINHPNIAKYNISSIECCISGSAPLPAEVQQKFEQLTGGRLVEGYGLSEASPVTHVNPIWGKRVNGSIGVPWSDTVAKIIDSATGEELEPREIGELVVQGPQVMKGYWNQPEETAAVLKEGWLYTGDMGYMDENGYFYIVDRKKDVIIASGFKIYPREVEEVLYEHPSVKEAVVIGVPDRYRGETVKAFIVSKDGTAVSEEELDHYCREKLASYKVPRIYEFRTELPKSIIGKILRRVLVEEEKRKIK